MSSMLETVSASLASSMASLPTSTMCAALCLPLHANDVSANGNVCLLAALQLAVAYVALMIVVLPLCMTREL